MKPIYTLIFILCSSAVFAQALSRGAFVEEITNEHSSFAVRVSVDKADNVYAKNELLRAYVTSSEDGYLYLMYRDSEGKVSVLFPNRFQQDNFIQKNETVTIPPVGSKFQIRMDAPFGEETLKAVVMKTRQANIDTVVFFNAGNTPVSEGTMKSFKMFRKSTSDWAEHHVRIQTVETRDNDSSTDTGERHAVCVGVGDYKDQSIPKLSVCPADAEKMRDMLVQRCGVKRENVHLLTDAEATLANLRKTINDDLPKATKPGDTVFFFWSGHGGQTPDLKKEFLLPYDASGEDLEGTMLMDETFGRWIQDLDGRKVLVVIDACHSGGMANNAKSFSKSSKTAEWKPLRFAFTRLATAKDIGQKDAAVIASSTQDEKSLVRKEGDLSVFTYYALQVLTEAKTPLSHVEWYRMVKPLVTEYVDQSASDRKQTVVMQDDMDPPLVINQ